MIGRNGRTMAMAGDEKAVSFQCVDCAPKDVSRNSQCGGQFAFARYEIAWGYNPLLDCALETTDQTVVKLPSALP